MLLIQKRVHLSTPVAALLLLFLGSVAHAPQDDSLEDDFKKGVAPGEKIFISTGAGCHGLDGRGSEKAPNITGSSKVQRYSDAQVSNIISNGVPGTGMPAFHSLNPAQVRLLVNYVRVLQGKIAARALPGNPSRGKEIFFGKGGCSSCHTVSGEGGFLGSDLTTYGSDLPAEDILDRIVKPGSIDQPGYRSVTVTTSDGVRVEGVVRNEDNFSVQVQDKVGTFHLLEQSEVKSLEYSAQSLMPANYGDQLTHAELNDLVSYLMCTGQSAAAGPSKK